MYLEVADQASSVVELVGIFESGYLPRHNQQECCNCYSLHMCTTLNWRPVASGSASQLCLYTVPRQFPAAGLVPLLVRLLYPKMRKRSGRLGGKGAPGSARAAILNYLAALDSMELGPLVQLFLQPISTAFKQQQEAMEPSGSIPPLRLAPPAFLLLHALAISEYPHFQAQFGVMGLECYEFRGIPDRVC